MAPMGIEGAITKTVRGYAACGLRGNVVRF
jgi:hypothetical protein